MRIVVLGNCQAHGIAHGLAHLLPETRIQVAQIDGGPQTSRAQAAASLIEDTDTVFTQRLDTRWKGIATDALTAAGRRVVVVPKVLFRGYQPDMAYLMLDNRPVESPVGAYHSCIVAAAFSLDVAEADVATLFNRLVYARLGFLEAFGKERTMLTEAFAPCGDAFAASFESWHARGPFMHTLNHPRAFVLADIARAAAIGAGLLRRDAPRVTPGFDHLAGNVIWPVYPEIAEALGVPGSLVFKRAARPGIASGDLHLGLPAFIHESYARYARLPAEAFRNGAVGEARVALADLLGHGAG